MTEFINYKTVGTHAQPNVEFWLTNIASKLRYHVQDQGAKQTLGALGVFYCRQSQSLQAIPLHQPGVVLVLSGTKYSQNEQYRDEIYSGQLLMYPAGAKLHIGNKPAVGSDYLAMSVSFKPDLLERFISTYGTELELWTQPPLLKATATIDILHALSQWLDLCLTTPQSPLVHAHRAQEILLLLAQKKLAGIFFRSQSPSWQQKVAACFELDISRHWRMEDVAARFGCSDATLRRRLNEENCSFRQLLEEVRLTSGLGLLQETDWTVLRIAQSVGYESASRFTERFRLRFAITPQELRATQRALDVNVE